VSNPQSRHNPERTALFAARDPRYKVRTRAKRTGYPDRQPFFKDAKK